MLQNRTVSRKQIVTLFFLGLLIFILYHVFLILSPFVGPIFWASVLTFIFYPIFKWLRKTLRTGNSLAACFTTLIVFLILTPTLFFMLKSLADELLHFYQWFSGVIDNGEVENILQRIKSIPWVQEIRETFFQFEWVRQNAKAWFSSQANALLRLASRETGVVTKNIFLFFTDSLLTLFLTFFFLRDGEKIYEFIYESMPLEEKTKKEVFGQLNETFSAVIRGQFITSIAQATLTWVVFALLGLPVPILMALLTFAASLLPIFGAAAIWFPFAVYLLVAGQIHKAAVLFVFGAGIISLVDNFLKPLIIGEKTKLPYFLLFIGILGGLDVYGFMGAFLAPLVLSVFFVLIKIYREKFLS